MNGKRIPDFSIEEINKSVHHFMSKNPDGATLQRIVFEVQSDALLSGCMPPEACDIQADIDSMHEYVEVDAYIHITPPQSDDWQYQRIPCSVVEQVRQVLAEAIKACNHTDKPILAGVDLCELLESLRIKEK